MNPRDIAGEREKKKKKKTKKPFFKFKQWYFSKEKDMVLFVVVNDFGLMLNILHRLVGLVVKASASTAEGPGFESRLRRDFFGVESYQWLKNWHSSGYPARRLAL